MSRHYKCNTCEKEYDRPANIGREINNLIRDLLEDGKTISEIIPLVNRSRYTIYRIMYALKKTNKKTNVFDRTCDECRNRNIEIYKRNMANAVFTTVNLKKWGLKPSSHHLHGRGRPRMMVRIRDNFTCQECGAVRIPQECGIGKKYQKSLDVHHIEGQCGKNSRGYDSTKDLSKMITLCHSCHYNRHDHTYGQLRKD